VQCSASSEGPDRLEILTDAAIPDVELVANYRKPHGMRAKQQLTILNGVKPRVVRNICSAAAVPAHAMPVFRVLHKSQVSGLKFQGLVTSVLRLET